jgi:hypothetical protein
MLMQVYMLVLVIDYLLLHLLIFHMPWAGLLSLWHMYAHLHKLTCRRCHGCLCPFLCTNHAPDTLNCPISSCFRKSLTQLSAPGIPCLAAKACKADAEKLCSNVQGADGQFKEGGVIACLRCAELRLQPRQLARQSYYQGLLVSCDKGQQDMLGC